MATDIAIKNVGPIQELTIPVPEGGGVVVVTGPNGRGKTKAIESVTALATGKGPRLEPRDGTKGGEVSGFGCKILVGHSNRRTGDSKFVSLGQKLDVAKLVDPGMASPEANDARRIKALVGLIGAATDPTMFHELVGSQESFDKIVQPDSIVIDDPVESARLVKRDIEAAARNWKSQADTAEGHAKGKEEAADATAAPEITVSDEQAQADLTAAIRAEAALLERASQAEVDAKKRSRAVADLQCAKASYDGPSVVEASTAHDTALVQWKEANVAWQEAEAAATAAGRKAENLRLLLQAAEQKMQAAKQHAATIAGWEKSLEVPPVAMPSADELAQAKQQAEQARHVVENLAVARKAGRLREEAQEARDKATQLKTRAGNLREAARSVDGVLSRLIEGSRACLRVIGTDKGPRLVTDTDRGETLFAELSDGERVRIALEIAIETLERLAEEEKVGGVPLLPLPQAFWEGLDPEHRAEVAEIAKRNGVVIITAECSDGPLRVEVA